MGVFRTRSRNSRKLFAEATPHEPTDGMQPVFISLRVSAGCLSSTQSRLFRRKGGAGHTQSIRQQGFLSGCSASKSKANGAVPALVPDTPRLLAASLDCEGCRSQSSEEVHDGGD